MFFLGSGAAITALGDTNPSDVTRIGVTAYRS